ncbi:unnamed protein product [Menidia menidia]|uniref:BRISC and BRCA1-A complex member 2 n=1 Tax=Menidia menidia TaxID=238744 RepID=A0A8S4AC23_9TELE|nr:unnamed protein product [Menidia menidia]
MTGTRKKACKVSLDPSSLQVKESSKMLPLGGEGPRFKALFAVDIDLNYHLVADPLQPVGAGMMNNMSPEVALHRISPELRPLLCSVVRNGRVGLDSTNCLRVTDLKTGCTSLTPGPCCDRFKLHIPYAGETLKFQCLTAPADDRVAAVWRCISIKDDGKKIFMRSANASGCSANKMAAAAAS